MCEAKEEMNAKAMGQNRSNLYGGALGRNLDTIGPSRSSIQESAQSQAYEAQRQAMKATRLQELADLLSKNPDVARILDLMEEVRR